MDHFCYCVSCLSCFLSVRCSLVVTYLEKTDLLTLLCVMFYCDFVTFSSVVLVRSGA